MTNYLEIEADQIAEDNIQQNLEKLNKAKPVETKILTTTALNYNNYMESEEPQLPQIEIIESSDVINEE